MAAPFEQAEQWCVFGRAIRSVCPLSGAGDAHSTHDGSGGPLSRREPGAIDQHGRGAGERHPTDVSRAAYAADVIAVLDQLELRNAALFGPPHR